jgi:hypothetical protein
MVRLQYAHVSSGAYLADAFPASAHKDISVCRSTIIEIPVQLTDICVVAPKRLTVFRTKKTSRFLSVAGHADLDTQLSYKPNTSLLFLF